MSFSISSILPSDGRLGSKRSTVDLSKKPSSGADPSAAQGGRVGYLLSTLRTSRIRRNNQLLSNANDAISLIQVAENALDATTAALHKIRSFSTQPPDEADMNRNRFDVLAEKTGLKEEIGKIFDNATFNNQPLLNGGVNNQAYSVGDNPDRTIPITIGNVRAIISSLRERMGEMATEEHGVDRQAINEAQTKIIDGAIGSVSRVRTTLGTLQNRFEEAISHLHKASESTLEITSQIQDADFAAETATLTRNVILKDAELSIPAQANQHPHIAMELLE